jgi:hypothetical protein
MFSSQVYAMDFKPCKVTSLLMSHSLSFKLGLWKVCMCTLKYKYVFIFFITLIHFAFVPIIIASQFSRAEICLHYLTILTTYYSMFVD